MVETSSKRLLSQALIAVAAVAACIIGINLLFGDGPSRPKRGKTGKRRATLVQLHTAVPTSHTLTIRGFGLVVPAQQVALTPQLRGQVTHVHEDLIPGRMVNKNSKLVTIDSRDYQFALERARSVLAKARASLAIEQGSHKVAAEEATQLSDLVQGKQRSLVLREPQLAAAKAELFAARAEFRQAKINLERTKLVAPFDALVIDRRVSVGMLVSEQTPVATLVDTHEWWVRVELPVAKLRLLSQEPSAGREAGQRAVIWGHNGLEAREGVILQLGNSVEDRGRLATVLIAIRDPLAREKKGASRLVLNTWARVEMTGISVVDALVIPPEWLRADNHVWLADREDQLVFRPVDVIYQDDKEVVIRGSIAAGERVVTTPIASPVKGMRLRFPAASEQIKNKQ